MQTSGRVEPPQVHPARREASARSHPTKNISALPSSRYTPRGHEKRSGRRATVAPKDLRADAGKRDGASESIARLSPREPSRCAEPQSPSSLQLPPYGNLPIKEAMRICKQVHRLLSSADARSSASIVAAHRGDGGFCRFSSAPRARVNSVPGQALIVELRGQFLIERFRTVNIAVHKKHYVACLRQDAPPRDG